MNGSFAIIGTAGREDDGKRLTKNHFEAMYECGRGILEQINKSNYPVDTVVSGGAAFADHVAVRLFLNKEVPKLRLYLPCKWNESNRRYDETPLTQKEREKGYSTGGIANSYHDKFTKKVGFNSLTDIFLAIEKGAEIYVCNGFFARNAKVAESDIILAMTFGDKEWLKDGGTAHCMRCYLNRVKKLHTFDKSFHYDMNSGNIFVGAKVRENPKLG